MSEYVTVFSKNIDRVNQGDIYRDIEFTESITDSHEGDNDFVTITTINYPFVIVLTQDCDLEQDYANKNKKNATNQDKYLLSVIVAPIYVADLVFSGTHLEKLGYYMQKIMVKNADETKVKMITQNEVPRYHYLNFIDAPLPLSIIDFKHYFTVPLNDLLVNKKENYVRTICPLFREKISQRFASYLSRIGLPESDMNRQEVSAATISESESVPERPILATEPGRR